MHASNNKMALRLLIGLVLLKLADVQVGAFLTSGIPRKCWGVDGRLFAEYKSVSDYMGGHHAGKFDFDPRICGVTALNYEKSVVFDDTNTNESPILASVGTEEVPPRWASRPVHSEATTETVSLGEGVTLTNEEISWEPFYATMETEGRVMLPSESGLTVFPASGNLAPRGGANNACNGKQPYTDSCVLTVHSQSNNNDLTSTIVGNSNVFLVVRTEMDFWSWRVVNN